MMLKKAWGEVTEQTIRSCFRKPGTSLETQEGAMDDHDDSFKAMVDSNYMISTVLSNTSVDVPGFVLILTWFFLKIPGTVKCLTKELPNMMTLLFVDTELEVDLFMVVFCSNLFSWGEILNNKRWKVTNRFLKTVTGF